MNDKLQKILQSLLPFMLLGVAIALMVGLFIMFSYVLIWGLVIGGILWIIATIKALLFSPRKIKKPRRGRIIEHDKH